MAEHKNCPNCAAPYDPIFNRCPYCGTLYFDMSVIDFDKCEPFWLKIRFGGSEITQYVVPNLDVNITMESNTVYATTFDGRNAIPFREEPEITTEMSFRSVRAPGSNIFANVTKIKS